jgi:hypothetical protein
MQESWSTPPSASFESAGAATLSREAKELDQTKLQKARRATNGRA